MSIHRLVNSIVTRILVLGLAIVLAGALARYFFLTDFLRRDLGAVTAVQQQMLADYVANDIDSEMRERDAVLKRLAATLPVETLQADARELRSWLGERQTLLPMFFDRLVVLDARGALLADFPQSAERNTINYAEFDYFRAALAGSVAIGRPTRGSVAGQAVLPMATPVRDASGRVRAVLVGLSPMVPPGFLTISAHGRDENKSGEFMLVSPRDRLYVAATDPALVLKPTPAPGVDTLHDRAMSGYRGSGLTMNTRGIEQTVAMATVPSTGWFVVARVANTAGLASLGRVTRYVAVNSVAVAAIFLLIAAGLLISMFRPLFRAADIADRMTRGEIALEPLPVVHADEVGHLTAAFNRLLAKLQTSQLELARMAHHDSLTGLPNSTLLADRLSQSLARAQRNDRLVGVLYLDLDSFKPVNDELGHGAGDAALVEVARRLAGAMRETDTVARIGGDEFIIVMDDLDPSGDIAAVAAATVAAKCIAAIGAPMILQGQPRQVGVSIGIALGDGGSTADSLRKAADVALYQAKNGGGQRYVLYVEPGSEIHADEKRAFAPDSGSAEALLQASMQRSFMPP